LTKSVLCTIIAVHNKRSFQMSPKQNSEDTTYFIVSKKDGNKFPRNESLSSFEEALEWGKNSLVGLFTVVDNHGNSVYR